ncbi:hypothetical protein PA39016_001350032 [Pseudomonas aeruginosa 39016]|nr:hypothetical protein PA39016_001350032 [Pseudomonas aeruginosa 39016]
MSFSKIILNIFHWKNSLPVFDRFCLSRKYDEGAGNRG